MKLTAIGFALLLLTPLAMADRDDRRAATSGAIAWSTRDREGNKFAIVFEFGNRTAVNLRYEQDRYGRPDRYDRNDRYDRDDRYGREGRYRAPAAPPLYDYKRYKKNSYDTRYFGSFAEWNDWKQWQKHWSKRKNWNHDSRERARAWAAFCNERALAYDSYYRAHNGRNDRRDDDRDDRRWTGRG